MSALCESRHSERFSILLLVGKGAQVRGASPVKLPRRRFLHLAAGAAALPAMPRVASALDYPTRPVRIIVGFPAGGSSDLTARLIGQWLSERLGQQFNILRLLSLLQKQFQKFAIPQCIFERKEPCLDQTGARPGRC
jgi:hypothetical protein